MSEGTSLGAAPATRGPWSAVLGDYGRRLRFPVAANVSLMVLLPGAVGLLGDVEWPRAYCSLAGAMVLMVWTGLVSGHLKLALARPENRLLPGYPQVQVRAAGAVVLPAFALSLFFHWIAGFGALTSLAFTLLVTSLFWVGPWFFSQGHLMLILGPPLVMLASRSRFHGWWRPLGLGWPEPAWALLGIFFSTALIGLVIHRMLRLNESFPEYHRDPAIGWRPGRPIDTDVPFSGVFNRLVPWFGRYRVSGLASRYGAGFLARVQLWRLGMSPASPMVTGLSLAGMVALVGLAFIRHPANTPANQAGVLLVYVSFFSLTRAAYLHRRKERLGYELLYPAPRQAMLRELGAATAVDLAVTWTFLWAGTLVLRGLGLFPGVPWTTLLSYAPVSLGMTVLGLGLATWILPVRGNSPFLLLLYVVTLALGLPVAWAVARGPGLGPVVAWAVAGAGLAAFGAALAYGGYRSWCRRETGRDTWSAGAPR